MTSASCKDVIVTSHFTSLDAALAFLSLCTFVADVVTDVMVVILYASNGDLYWAGITVSVMVVSTVVVHYFSLRWYTLDGESNLKLFLINFFQLGVIYRYFNLIKMGLKLRRDGDECSLRDYQQRHSDVCMLRLFECFLESAPQVVLQMYIMFTNQDWNTFTELSVAVSLLSLAGGIASYSKSIRNATPHKDELSWVGLFLQMGWRAGTLVSRIIAMVLCASVLKAWFILICFVHWLTMTVWIIFQKTDFCPTKLEERIYNAVVGVIYCFCYFNLKEGKSRYRLTAFYTLIFSENLCFVMLFFCLSNAGPNVVMAMFAVVILSFGTGILCMLVYYCCFHPHGSVFNEKASSSLSDLVSQKSIIVTGLRFLRTLKSSYLQQPITPEKAKSTKLNIEEKIEFLDQNNFKPDASLPSRLGILEFADETPHLKCLDDHSFHSLNCLVLSDHSGSSATSTPLTNEQPSFLGRGFGTNRLANHHNLVNFSFRPQMSPPLAIHCSCLVLHDVHKDDVIS